MSPYSNAFRDVMDSTAGGILSRSHPAFEWPGDDEDEREEKREEEETEEETEDGKERDLDL